MLDIIKKADLLRAQKSMETSLDLTWKRQILIKLAGKTDACWLAVQEYGQEKLEDNSEDENKNYKSGGEVVQEETPGGYYRREVSFGSGYIVSSYC